MARQWLGPRPCLSVVVGLGDAGEKMCRAAPTAVAIGALVSAMAGCAAGHREGTLKTPGLESAHEDRASGHPDTAAALASSQPAQELPRGGRTLFPDHRLVGFCGTPGAPALGELQGNLPVKARALAARAAQYADGRKLLPVFELIAVVVQASPGVDGKYRHRVDNSVVDQYLRAARASKALLLLNIQPGQSDFLTEVKSFEVYLREPDVGVALDPEWAMKPKQRPGTFFGQTTGATVNDVAAFLSKLVEQNHLPEKALVFHEVVREVMKDESALTSYPGVALIKSIDGLGPVHAKVATYGNLMETMGPGVHAGFKLFFDEDTRGGGRLMTAKEVLALLPQPEYVMYE